MKNTIISILAGLAVIFSYQNCSQPIQDLGGAIGPSEVDCPLSPSQASINEPIQNGSNYRFDIFSDLEADVIRWTIQPLTSGIETNQPFLVQSIPAGGDYLVQAQGMITGCSTPLYTASRNFTVAGSVGCNSTFQLNANATQVQVGGTVVITMSSAGEFQASTIRWQLNGVNQTQWDNQSSVSYTADSAGDKIFSVTATANCGSNRNASVTVVVNQNQTGSASIINFDAKPFFGTTNPIRGTGRDSVYKISRSTGKKISMQLANLQSIQSSLTTSSGVNCTLPNCYLFDVVTTSGSCQYIEKSVVATGTNGSPNTVNLFIYCPANQTYCHTGLLENKEANENCGGCGVNLYIPTNATTCTAVGNGYYSPAGSNARSLCTNDKPANSIYSGPGINGANNCPSTACAPGTVPENNICVPASCDPITFRGLQSTCSFSASPVGSAQGFCQSLINNGSGTAHATCNADGSWTERFCECAGI